MRAPQQGVTEAMTATLDTPVNASAGSPGRVVRVIGPVIDVEFSPDTMPAIFNALTLTRELAGETSVVTLEVAAHIGDYPTEMTAHVFRSIAESLGAAVHVRVEGDNDHHKTEACFKAFGRALRQALATSGDALPSTKGVL